MVGKREWTMLGLLAAVLLLSGGHLFRSNVGAQQSGVSGGFQNYATNAAPAPTALVSRPLEVPKMYAFERLLENGVRQVVVVDSETKRICVYHIDPQGKIEFVANRNFEWDLKMEDFNGTGLTPTEIREAVERSSGAK